MCSSDLERKALKKRIASRFPAPLVPGACFQLMGLDEKDKDNSVLRLVAYKHQMDDILKILRKQGIMGRPFNYNVAKYNEDKNKRFNLGETLK